MSFLKNLDLFGLEAKWRLFRQDRFKTKFSGFISLLFFIYLGIKFFILIFRLFSKSEFSISFSDSKLLEEEAIDITDFEIAFCLIDKSNGNFVSFSDSFSLSTNFTFEDEYSRKFSDTEAIKVAKCTSIRENSIYFRKNFLKDKDLKLLDNCSCGYPDPEKFSHVKNPFLLSSTSLFGDVNYLNFKINTKNEQVVSSQFAVKVMLKDYSLSNMLDQEENSLNRIIGNQQIKEGVESFNFELENLFLKKINFFINEITYIEKINMEIYEKQSLISNYAIAENREENTLIKYSETNNKQDVLELKFSSNKKRLFYRIVFFGLNQFYIEFSANVLLIFLILRFFMKIYNEKNWDLFLNEIIGRRFVNYRDNKKKLEGYFNMNYFSNWEKEEVKKHKENKHMNNRKRFKKKGSKEKLKANEGDYASFANYIRNREKDEFKDNNGDYYAQMQHTNFGENPKRTSDKANKLNKVNNKNDNDLDKNYKIEDIVENDNLESDEMEGNYIENPFNPNMKKEDNSSVDRNNQYNLKNLIKLADENKISETYNINDNFEPGSTTENFNNNKNYSSSVYFNPENKRYFIDLQPLKNKYSSNNNINNNRNQTINEQNTIKTFQQTERKFIKDFNLNSDIKNTAKSKNYTGSNLYSNNCKNNILEEGQIESNKDSDKYLKADKESLNNVNISCAKKQKTIAQTIPPKVYDLKTVEIKEPYDIRKNIKDVFAFPKSRNKLLKDFIFRRVLDVDTYTNALMEFYKLQKILLSKDLLNLFKKISNSSLFEEKNFSYYDYCTNNYTYRDQNINVIHDKEDFFNNYVFENLKNEFYSFQP